MMLNRLMYGSWRDLVAMLSGFTLVMSGMFHLLPDNGPNATSSAFTLAIISLIISRVLDLTAGRSSMLVFGARCFNALMCVGLAVFVFMADSMLVFGGFMPLNESVLSEYSSLNRLLWMMTYMANALVLIGVMVYHELKEQQEVAAKRAEYMST